MLRFSKAINVEHCENKCTLGSGGKGVGYLAHGTATDYIYEIMKVPVVYTWEVYGDETADFEDCFKMFNPVTEEAHDAIVNAWVGAPITLVSLLETHPDITFEREHDGTIEIVSGSRLSRDPTVALPVCVLLAVAMVSLRVRRRLKNRKK
jgi:hypothetical protein